MRRGTTRGALCFLGCLLLLAGAPRAWGRQDAPYIPANADVVLQRVPPTTDPRVRRFDRLRAELARRPHDVRKVVALAQAYVDYARSTGDARFLGRAMAVISPLMKRPQPPIPVLLVHATIQQSRHFFKASRQELGRILERDPDNAQAWLTLATVAMVQGDVATANRSCVHLANSAGSFMGTVCSASLRSLTGHGRQALALLSLVADPGPRAPPAIRSWIEGLMADVDARLGLADAAGMHFRKALELTPGDNFLIADYGDFLLDQRRPRDVIDLVGDHTESDTSFLRVVLAEQMMGSPSAARDAAAMDARFRAMDARGSHVYRREQAAFVLYVQHDAPRALVLARQNWTVQRAPKDVRVYLEAALASHDPEAARPVLDFIARTGLEDARIDGLVAQARAALASPSSTVSQAEVPK